MQDEEARTGLVELTADIVAAYVANNPVVTTAVSYTHLTLPTIYSV